MQRYLISFGFLISFFLLLYCQNLSVVSRWGMSSSLENSSFVLFSIHYSYSWYLCTYFPFTIRNEKITKTTKFFADENCVPTTKNHLTFCYNVKKKMMDGNSTIQRCKNKILKSPDLLLRKNTKHPVMSKMYKNFQMDV